MNFITDCSVHVCNFDRETHNEVSTSVRFDDFFVIPVEICIYVNDKSIFTIDDHAFFVHYLKS